MVCFLRSLVTDYFGHQSIMPRLDLGGKITMPVHLHNTEILVHIVMEILKLITLKHVMKYVTKRYVTIATSSHPRYRCFVMAPRLPSRRARSRLLCLSLGTKTM